MEKNSPYWTEIRGFDSTGKPVAGLPGNGGYFEMHAAQGPAGRPAKSLELKWIDFYRK